MRPSPTLEDRLKSTAEILRDRPSLVDRVMGVIRQSADRTTMDKPASDAARQ